MADSQPTASQPGAVLARVLAALGWVVLVAGLIAAAGALGLGASGLVAAGLAAGAVLVAVTLFALAANLRLLQRIEAALRERPEV